jgi:L-ribulokinase
MAAYKALYTKNGYPDPKIFALLDKKLENVVADKLNAPVIPLGSAVGRVTDSSREKFGISPDVPWLKTGTVVASPIPDGVCPASAVGAVNSGNMFASFGTSSNYMLISNDFKTFSGICGVVKDGIIPGLYAYEAGLCCFGDHFAWAAENLCNEKYLAEAKQKGISLLEFISSKAEQLAPGESGVIALNWWNGNRNPLMNSSLSGLFVGMTLNTRPEDLFRAIVEANAFGTRVILENFEANGIEIDHLISVGGITRKSPFTMQLLADVLGKKVQVSDYIHSAALGASIHAAVAAGKYATIEEACGHMAVNKGTVYFPNTETKDIYDALYNEYLTLHDYFGRGGNDVMKRLRDISKHAK